MIILKIIWYVKNGKLVHYIREAKLTKQGTYLIIDLNEKIYYIIDNKKHIPIINYNELMDFIDNKGLELLG